MEDGSPEYVEAMDDAVIALMIEKKGAVDNLEEVLSVKGIDMVQFGPGDYSMSIGIPRQWSHPRVKEAELKTIKTALKMGIRPRVEFGAVMKDEDIEHYMDLGVLDFCLPGENAILYQWLNEHGKHLNDVLSKG